MLINALVKQNIKENLLLTDIYLQALKFIYCYIKTSMGLKDVFKTQVPLRYRTCLHHTRDDDYVTKYHSNIIPVSTTHLYEMMNLHKYHSDIKQ